MRQVPERQRRHNVQRPLAPALLALGYVDWMTKSDRPKTPHDKLVKWTFEQPEHAAGLAPGVTASDSATA